MSNQDIAYAASAVSLAAQSLAQEISAYHATWFSVLKPRLYMDGDAWCALYGDDIQSGVCGFGETPAKALMAFETAMCLPSGSRVTFTQGPAECQP